MAKNHIRFVSVITCVLLITKIIIFAFC